MKFCFDIAEFDDWVYAFVVSEEYWKKHKELDETISVRDIQKEHPEFKFPEAAEAMFEVGKEDEVSIGEAKEKLKSMGMKKISLEHL